ncbi:MAG: class F sortase [Tepidiformaceae bacterium]
MRRIRLPLGLAALALFAVAAACGGDGDPDPTPTATTTVPPSATTAVDTATAGPTEGPSQTPAPEATATPAGTPPPGPSSGPQAPTGNSAVASIALPSGGVSASSPVELRDTHYLGGAETFQDPSHPSRIAYYQRYGVPGVPGANAIFAAHVDYVGYGKGPFAYLTSSTIGDTLSLTLTNGAVLNYSVASVQVIQLDQLDMNPVVFPALPSNKERVTLISCGGTFVPNASGVGGEYNSRVILTAERYLN